MSNGTSFVCIIVKGYILNEQKIINNIMLLWVFLSALKGRGEGEEEEKGGVSRGRGREGRSKQRKSRRREE